MGHRTAVRWQNWDATGVEHLVLSEGKREIMAESVVVGSVRGKAFAIHYRIRCDKSWRVRSAEVDLIGGDRRIEISSDGEGNWSDAARKPLHKLAGALDMDLSLT